MKKILISDQVKTFIIINLIIIYYSGFILNKNILHSVQSNLSLIVINIIITKKYYFYIRIIINLVLNKCIIKRAPAFYVERSRIVF